MKSNATVETRARRFAKMEVYIWVCIAGSPDVKFGWILSIRDGSVVFKDDETSGTVLIPLDKIESFARV